VVASRRKAHLERREPYAGKHTVVGAVLGTAVERAVGDGVRRWLADVT
jgi:adenosylcobinamide amidohydrolase